MVNEEMPRSYLLPTDGMMESKFDVNVSVFEPEYLAHGLGKVYIEAHGCFAIRG